MRHNLILILLLAILLIPMILWAQVPKIFAGAVYDVDHKVSGVRFGSTIPITGRFMGIAYGQAALAGGAAATDLVYLRKFDEWPGLNFIPLLSKLPIYLGPILGTEFDVTTVGDNGDVSTYLNAAIGGLANYEIGEMYGAWIAGKNTVKFDPNALFPAGWTFGAGIYINLARP